MIYYYSEIDLRSAKEFYSMLYFSLDYSLLKGVLVLPYKFFMTHANLYLCLAYLAELRWGGQDNYSSTWAPPGNDILYRIFSIY